MNPREIVAHATALFQNNPAVARVSYGSPWGFQGADPSMKWWEYVKALLPDHLDCSHDLIKDRVTITRKPVSRP